MGYRLYIHLKSDWEDIEKGIFKNDKPIWQGGKLFGYCYEEKLKSFQYLCEIGKVEEERANRWHHNFSAELELTPNQCETFCKLYIEDMIETFMADIKTKDEIEQYRATKLLDLEKLLKYNENVVLDWG